MKVHIEQDEWYPVYIPVKDKPGFHWGYEMPDDLMNRWSRVQDEFNAIQEELELHDKIWQGELKVHRAKRLQEVTEE